MQNLLRSNLAEITKRIERAARKVDRNPDEVKLVAVSKTHTARIIKDAIAAGAKVLGENKVQEAEDKISVIYNGADKLIANDNHQPAFKPTVSRLRNVVPELSRQFLICWLPGEIESPNSQILFC